MENNHAYQNTENMKVDTELFSIEGPGPGLLAAFMKVGFQNTPNLVDDALGIRVVWAGVAESLFSKILLIEFGLHKDSDGHVQCASKYFNLGGWSVRL